MPTNTPRSLLAASLVVLIPNLASAQSNLNFLWQDTREWIQTGPTSNFYLGGATDVSFQDGFWTLSGCFQPSTTRIFPNIFCPLGTTGFIAQGDVDFDGQNDQGSFWSIATVQRAARIEPFRPDQFRILSAPPSGIADKLRSSGGDISEIFDIIDESVIIWYDVLAPPPDDYEITIYGATRPYGSGRGEERRHYKDVPWGTYLFTLPEINSLAEPPRPVPFAVTHLVTPDAFPGRGAIAQGWLMTNENWFNGELQFDPRTFFNFEWFGLTFQNTLASDTLFMSMRANQYVESEALPREWVTRAKNPPEFIVTGTVTGVACNTITTNIDFDANLEQGKNYQFNIIDGELAGTTEYPVTVYGTGGGLRFNELDTPNDITGETVTGVFTAINGTTLTTDRDLTACLNPGAAYEITFNSGGVEGITQFPITVWNGMDLETLVDVSASLAPGDTFTLNQKQQVIPSTVQTVAGFFIEGDLDLTFLVRGGDYRIEVTSGALAGNTFPIANWGFPNNFFFETRADLSASLQPGDTYEFRVFDPPGFFIKPGDTFSISQTFEDWVQDLYDNGEVVGVPAFRLSNDPDLFPPDFGPMYLIPATPDLEVDFGPDPLFPLGPPEPLYAVARDDVIVFPPHSIQNPRADRSQFVLGTFDGEYELGPFFFREGDSVTGRLHMQRSIPAGAFTTDRTARILNFKVQFIDTYEGFAILGGLAGGGFPFGTPSSQRQPGFDFDRDGANNLMEFAMQTDVVDPNDRPSFQFALGEQPGQCTATLQKRRFVGNRLIYYFEYSTNLVNWTTILPGDPVFDIVQDDETTLTVSNIAAVQGNFPPPSCFLRIKVVLQ